MKIKYLDSQIRRYIDRYTFTRQTDNYINSLKDINMYRYKVIEKIDRYRYIIDRNRYIQIVRQTNIYNMYRLKYIGYLYIIDILYQRQHLLHRFFQF